MYFTIITFERKRTFQQVCNVAFIETNIAVDPDTNFFEIFTGSNQYHLNDSFKIKIAVLFLTLHVCLKLLKHSIKLYTAWLSSPRLPSDRTRDGGSRRMTRRLKIQFRKGFFRGIQLKISPWESVRLKLRPTGCFSITMCILSDP
jgi:hypothetical protein